MTSRSIPLVALLGAIAAAGSVPAHARHAPNPETRLVRDLEGARAAWTGSARPAVVHFVPVPLPTGAVQIDSTWYDLQDMGSLGARVVIGTDGRVHATWQDDFCELDPAGCPPNLSAPQPHPQRGMGYAARTGGVWTNFGKVRDYDIPDCPQCGGPAEVFGGFGGIAVTPTNRAALSQHMNEDSCDERGDMYLQDATGGSTWTAYLSEITEPSYLFPQITALPNGSFVMLGEVPRGGSYDETNGFRVARLAAAGTPFVCPLGWQFGNWTAVGTSALYRDGRPAFPVIASASDGRAGVAVTDFGGNVFLFESSNGTFATGTVTTRNLTNYSDATVTATDSTSTQFRPFIHCHLAYNDTTPNVVWSELQARRSGGSIIYLDHRTRIRHWSSVTGLAVVKQVQAGEADRYDDIDLGLAGPIAGFNTLSVDWPQVGFSPDGAEVYVAWLRFVDGEIDPTADAGAPGIVTGVGFGDIACSVSRDHAAWSTPQNLTQTSSTDERFFSLAARNPSGHAHVLFQASAMNQAGVSIIGDRGPSAGNVLRRIAYLERPLAASVVAVGDVSPSVGLTTLRSWPNPARGRVSFSMPGGSRGREGFVNVMSPNGRLVARVRVSSTGAAEWDGRESSGRPAPAGLYLAHVDGPGAPRATKFLLMR